jgi:predicted Zn-dependent peptidase
MTAGGTRRRTGMRCLVLLPLAAGLLGSGLIASAAPLVPNEPGVDARTLPNGLLVLVRERPSDEVAAIDIAVRGGSRDEEPATVGAAHFMEHLYFQGTPSRPSAPDILDPITARGGWLNGHTDWESVNFQAVVPAGSIGLAIEVLGDQLSHSLFDPVKLDKERRVILEELNRRQSSPDAYLLDRFRQTLFQGHPLENLPIGNRETLDRDTRDVVVQFRDTYFVANNTVVAVVGNVQHDEIFARVGAAFTDMPSGPPPPFHPAAPPAPGPRRVEELTPGQQARVAVGGIAPGLDSGERSALDLAMAVLGDGGQRLASEIVERRGLAATLSVSYQPLTDVGLWTITATTAPAMVEPTLEAMRASLRTMAETPLTDEELDAARAFIRGAVRLGGASSSRQAANLANGTVLGSYQPVETYLARIWATPAAEVQAVARKYLDPDALTVVVLRPG